jgi:tryptophan 2-monooxygenase
MSGKRPLSMFGPDFPFAYDDFLKHPAGLCRLPAERRGTRVAVVGAGLAGIVAAHELLKLGLEPVLFEADRIGGRLRTEPFVDGDGAFAELGAMRFPPSSTCLFHYLDAVGLNTRPFPNPLSEAAGST